MLIEVKFIGKLVQVRKAIDRDDSRTKVWSDLQPGDADHDSGLTYEELRELGEGYHEIE